MDDALPDARLSFCAYFIRLHGPESGPIIRVLLVETSKAKSIYEGFGSWPQCEHWIGQLTGWIIPRDLLAVLRKRLEQKQLATINVVRTSVEDIESVGLSRVDS
jgi:phage major head subunit gpT-like protein